MNQQTENTLRAAQVNRNAKWLLHAVAALRRELKSVRTDTAGSRQ
jgi:hypothetical protein